jgi:glycosyltransferase involved in cell wall biosynthesis
MASGLPVVARDIPGARDLVTDGEEGVIASDVEGLARALSELAGSRERRREMGARARQRALAFTAERFAEKAKKFYEEILTG